MQPEVINTAPETSSEEMDVEVEYDISTEQAELGNIDEQIDVIIEESLEDFETVEKDTSRKETAGFDNAAPEDSSINPPTTEIEEELLSLDEKTESTESLNEDIESTENYSTNVSEEDSVFSNEDESQILKQNIVDDDEIFFDNLKEFQEELANELESHVMNEYANEEKADLFDSERDSASKLTQTKQKEVLSKKNKPIKIDENEETSSKLKKVKETIKNIIKNYKKEDMHNPVESSKKPLKKSQQKHKSLLDKEHEKEEPKQNEDDILDTNIESKTLAEKNEEEMPIINFPLKEENDLQEKQNFIDSGKNKLLQKVKKRKKAKEPTDRFERKEKISYEEEIINQDDNRFIEENIKQQETSKTSETGDDNMSLESEIDDSEMETTESLFKAVDETVIKELKEKETVKRSIEVKIPSKGIKVKITDGNIIEILETDSGESNDEDVKVKITGIDGETLGQNEKSFSPKASPKKEQFEAPQTKRKQKVKKS